jgi:hypothetical protein
LDLSRSLSSLVLVPFYSYGFGGTLEFGKPYLTSEDGFSFDWIPGGAVSINQGAAARAGIESERQAQEKLATTSEQRRGTVSIPTAATEAPRYGLLNVEWSYQLDPLSSIFMLIVTGVGLCIFVFATGYMHGEAGFYRFFAYMGIFMFAMLVLVMGSNFLMMFVGWEGVGLCSYLLIGYYFDRQEAANASRKAFITNRVGDFGFALAIFGIIATFGSAQYSEVFEHAKSYPMELLGHWGILSWIALGLFIGACGKSAQIPVACVAAGCDGGSDSSLCPDSCRDNGDRGPLHGHAHKRHLPTLADNASRRCAGWCCYGDLCSDDRHYSERHQEGPCLFNRLTTRFHVHGLRRRSFRNWHLST